MCVAARLMWCYCCALPLDCTHMHRVCATQAAAELGVTPRTAWLDAAIAASARQLGQLTAVQLADLAAALADLGAAPRRWGERGVDLTACRTLVLALTCLRPHAARLSHAGAGWLRRRLLALSAWPASWRHWVLQAAMSQQQCAWRWRQPRLALWHQHLAQRESRLHQMMCQPQQHQQRQPPSQPLHCRCAPLLPRAPAWQSACCAWGTP